MTTHVRYQGPAGVRYGVLVGSSVLEIHDTIFDPIRETDEVHALGDVKLLFPCVPPKILAVGLNYRSHLGGRPAPEAPGIFYKPVTALQNPGDPIVLPADAEDVHYEGELVVVIGRPTRNATRDEAAAAIFGVTCGNDVSDRNWQRGAGKDLQWWRAKGCDTFAPLGPVIVTGLDYGDLVLETRLNGEIVQKQSTSDLIFDAPTVVSWISRWVTLERGDLIYTGTPGETRRIHPGDTVDVEIQHIGVLSNPVTAGY